MTNIKISTAYICNQIEIKFVGYIYIYYKFLLVLNIILQYQKRNIQTLVLLYGTGRGTFSTQG